MTIEANHPSLVTSLYSNDIFFGFILVDYQTGLWEKYLVTGDWSQSRTGSVLPKFVLLEVGPGVINLVVLYRVDIIPISISFYPFCVCP